MHVRWHLLGASALLAVLLWASPALGADAPPDPLEGRWELASESGAPLDFGPTYDFVATGPGALSNKVVRNWPIGCQAFDGQIKLTRISSPAAQPAYRGTFATRIPPTCKAGANVNIELLIRSDGIARLFFNDGSGLIQHFRRRSIQIGQLDLSFRDRIDRAAAELRPQVLRLGRKWNAVQGRIATLSATAVKLRDTSAEQKGIADAEKDLADYRGGLAQLARTEERAPNDPGLAVIRNQWEKKVSDALVEIGRLRTRIGKNELKRLETEQALRAAIIERTQLDDALTDIARRLSVYDFEVSEVTVTADGVVVYRARTNTVLAKALKRIDAKLERLETTLARLDSERAKAKAEFLVAQRAALAAGERVQRVIWQNFAAGAAAEVGFLALDIGVAALRAGIIGVAVELTKKAAEIAVSAIAPESGDVDATDIRRLYGVKVKDVLGPSALKRAALDRFLKETAFRSAVKDPATKFLTERVFAPAKFQTAFEQAGNVLAGEPTEANLKKLERSVQSLLGARARLEDFKARQKLKPGRLRTAAEGIAKDAAKLLIKKALDARERESYVDYLEKQIEATALTTQFLAASSTYWDAKAGKLGNGFEVVEPGYDQLANEKRRLLALPNQARVLVSKPFSHGATLRVSLKGQGRAGPIRVVLGGEAASPVGRFAYQLRASADRADANGKVLLEVR